MTYELIEKLVAFLVEERRLCPRYGGDDRYGKIDSLIAEVRAARAESVQSHEVWLERIVKAVAELPDRNSTEGQPEMMLVSGEELAAILRNHPAAVPERELYEHKKSGGVYELVCFGLLERDKEPVAIYRHHYTKEVWVRSSVEFNDGRFEKLIAISASKPAGGE